MIPIPIAETVYTRFLNNPVLDYFTQLWTHVTCQIAVCIYPCLRSLHPVQPRFKARFHNILDVICLLYQVGDLVGMNV
jgi:hypothetical protein